MRKKWIHHKCVIISGASGGIGFNLAKNLIEKYDCKVIGIARNEQKLQNAALSLETKKDKFICKAFDVSIKDNWINFSKWLIESNIQPDVLINNAGFMLPFSKFEDYTNQEIEEIINTNFVSYVNSIKILLPLLKKSKSPAIINVSSAAGTCAVVGESLYCATKFAVRGFTEVLQQDYSKEIYIGGIYPGFIRTNILGRMSESAKQNKLIQKLMMPVEKAAKKMTKGIVKKKKRIVMGIDGCHMTFYARIFPKITPKIITTVLKLSKLEMFNELYD